MPLRAHDAVARFIERFGTSPRWVARAPGRVNLIGEHTDYNDGFVLPLAIDRAIWIALRPREDRRVVVYSADYQAEGEFDLDQLVHQDDGWLEFIKGVAWSLSEAGNRLMGWEGVILGDVPVGAGLSSSAALEVAATRAFAATAGLLWEPKPMALVAQRAENDWVGVNCGIMDQLISASARADHLLLIDCRSLNTRPVPFPDGAVVVVLDTGTRRGLVNSHYNERRHQCEAAAEFFQVKALRDVPIDRFEHLAKQLDEHVMRRALHVITENDRTLQAVAALDRCDLKALGALMNQSHQSLCEDYEVSSDALDLMVELARSQPSCYGARMTGAGFGGCAIALVEEHAAGAFAETVAVQYQRQTEIAPHVYVCHPSAGAEILDVTT